MKGLVLKIPIICVFTSVQHVHRCDCNFEWFITVNSVHFSEFAKWKKFNIYFNFSIIFYFKQYSAIMLVVKCKHVREEVNYIGQWKLNSFTKVHQAFLSHSLITLLLVAGCPRGKSPAFFCYELMSKGAAKSFVRDYVNCQL